MDLYDVSKDAGQISLMKRLERSIVKADENKGHLAYYHPPEVVIRTFINKFQPGPQGPPMRREDQKTTGHVMLITNPYTPSITPVAELEAMPLSQMRLLTPQHGKKVLIRVITPPVRDTTTVKAVVEDEEGTAAFLELSQQLEDKVEPHWEVVLRNSVAIIKEPFFIDEPCAVKVDHPGDIIWLREGDERIPQKWRVVMNRGVPDSLPHNTDFYRMYGNKCMGEKQFAAAHRIYSLAVETAETFEQKRMTYLNRSLANLKLDRPAKALADATALDSETSEPHEKTLYRQAQAHYALGNFEECDAKLQTLLKSFPENKAAKAQIRRSGVRQHEQRTGDYNYKSMYEQAKATPPLIDCATYSKPVEVRESPGRGRGLFTTKAVAAGDLVLCEKAFSYSFVDETLSPTRMLMNLATQKIIIGGPAYLLPQVTQKLYHDPQLLPDFYELYHGEPNKVDVVECDGAPVVDSFKVEKIIAMNAFGAPRSTCENLNDTERGRNQSLEPMYSTFPTAGIWLMASKINHSCVGNCRRSFIGDMQIVRATKDIPANTELLFCYHPPSGLQCYGEVQDHLSDWGFVCECALCKDRKNTINTQLQRRAAIFNECFAHYQGTGDIDIAKGNRLLRGIKSTYNGKAAKKVRIELAVAYTAACSYYARECMASEGGDTAIKALEALGFTIMASFTDQPRLKVKEWGMVHNYVPFLFLQLVHVYRDMEPEVGTTARNYAKLAYSMLVGEKETMPNMLCCVDCGCSL
ncbi:uncharacterized protein FIESC28_05020 [Fusarium coffeatum]|uniref:SET domain-containing protein n=1 Tax=Fusarium coffeatum TaxID=231269 RepID=A0A366RW99_9HYPO|nr:uncharacterized protein FIESC28_05020 [Fusarium coffeatum]RBR20868.1 hypothetical protein FIESC28_05020 [Fusarium coffeatum]